jgi:glutathionyl-hydroquinone reductase
MKLMNAGIFITNTNREDKYFEIIEKAQSVEEPEEISDTASFEEEVEYVEKKKQYDEAQDNLNTLEKYLNAYDALSKIRFTNTVLSEAKTSIINANNRDDIINAINVYQEKLKLFDKNSEV